MSAIARCASVSGARRLVKTMSPAAELCQIGRGVQAECAEATGDRIAPVIARLKGFGICSKILPICRASACGGTRPWLRSAGRSRRAAASNRPWPTLPTAREQSANAIGFGEHHACPARAIS